MPATELALMLVSNLFGYGGIADGDYLLMYN
jgi:hypothetical protein